MSFQEMVEKGILFYNDDRDLKQLLQYCNYLNQEEWNSIKRAYYLAEKMHEGTKREGGEPYFTHPLTVSFYAAANQMSASVIIACLLHDTLEDTPLTKEEIEIYFGEEVASFVDGVTKLKGFSSKIEKDAHNTSKLFRSFIHLAPEIFVIKLLDRLHNMTTIAKKKNVEKQIENANETLKIFVPMAKNLGCGMIQHALEDRSFHCLDPKKYQEIETRRKELLKKTKKEHNENMESIHQSLLQKGISNQVSFRMKTIYAIYKKEREGFEEDQIHDLFSLKVEVEKIQDCYRAIEAVHQVVTPVHYRMKDYIACPKTTGYQGFHTSGYSLRGTPYQVQIRTKAMADYASRGICVYGNRKSGSMKEALEQFQFYKTLKELDRLIPDDLEFYEALYQQILSYNMYITLFDGSKLELPQKSTVWDLLCKLGKEKLLQFKEVTRDGQIILPETTLKDKDKVVIFYQPQPKLPPKSALDQCKTPLAKKMISSFYPKYSGKRHIS